MRLASAIAFGLILALAIAMSARVKSSDFASTDEPTEDDIMRHSIAACMLAGHAVQFDADARPIACKPKPFQ